jgi:hypothetical protein
MRGRGEGAWLQERVGEGVVAASEGGGRGRGYKKGWGEVCRCKRGLVAAGVAASKGGGRGVCLQAGGMGGVATSEGKVTGLTRNQKDPKSRLKQRGSQGSSPVSNQKYLQLRRVVTCTQVELA